MPGVVDRNTVEKYYTDETGIVTRVDTYAGVRGAWSPELNKPVPNVTYNVVAQVDGGMQNTFTLVMDSQGHLASAKGHITSTLIGNMNRNGWQQLKVGRLGGAHYDGGHAGPSALGWVGECGGLFPHHEWQNRKAGIRNDALSNNFHDAEMAVIDRAKMKLQQGGPLDLNWDMELMPGSSADVPASTRLKYGFGSDDLFIRDFNNMQQRK